MTERILTRRQLNRTLLARQLLLERSTLTIPEAVEQVGGPADAVRAIRVRRVVDPVGGLRA